MRCRPNRFRPNQAPPRCPAAPAAQLGFFSEALLTHWPSCTRFYLVDLWGHQQNYEDIANVDQAEQARADSGPTRRHAARGG